MELWVLFPKTGFPENFRAVRFTNSTLSINSSSNSFQIDELFEDRNFNETQKKVKCRVLISYNEIRDITIQQLSQFMNEIENRKHPQYDIPVLFGSEKITQEVRTPVISNNDEFHEFLSYLYCLYRKIEIKIQQTGFPNILPDLDSQPQSLQQISSNLNTAKLNYKSVNKHDSPAIYAASKKLFFSYIHYIKYSIEHFTNMDEGDHLPGNVEEIKPWLEELNNWTPRKIDIERISWVRCFIVTPSGYEEIIRILQKTPRFKSYELKHDDNTIEPYIMEGNKNILFGFVKMEGAKPGENPDDSTLLELECPKECTQDSRKWICMKCGDYLSIAINIVGWRLLVCSCGSKRYKDELLICHHPTHQKRGHGQKVEEMSSSSASVKKETPRPVVSNDDLIHFIYRQLDQIRIRTEGTTDHRILIAIDYLSNRRIEKLGPALRDLKNMPLERHTLNLIDLYLDATTKSDRL